ncbi:MAG: hypothetical protein PF450_06515 [Bacteroidales bacterium]|nr:hypothetical protein [Bacteroidales bacterium]
MYDFLTSIGGFGQCTLDLSQLVSHDYRCACGQTHTFSYSTEIICQGAWKLILGCPNKGYVTCVKLKSKFFGVGFSGFKSISGTKLDKDPAKEESDFALRFVIKQHIENQ